MEGKGSRLVRVRNWDKYQHYKKKYSEGRMPWVKLHQKLLDDYDFAKLDDEIKWQAIGLLLLAAGMDNLLPADPAWLARKIGAEKDVDIEALVSVGWLAYSEESRQSLEGVYKASIRERDRERERDKESTNVDSSVPSSTATGLSTGIHFPCNGKPKAWNLPKEKLDEWEETYPAMDVPAEIGKARQWILDNPDRRKTARGMTRFLGAWLSRSNDKGTFIRKGSRRSGKKRYRFGDEVVEVGGS